MSTKAQERLKLCVEENKKIRFQRQAMVRALSAVLRKNGPIEIPYHIAAEVEDTDAVKVDFNKETGMYVVSLVSNGAENAEPVGSGSVEVGLQERGGDVEGSVLQTLPDGVSDEVREGDQHHSRPNLQIVHRDEESGGSE